MRPVCFGQQPAPIKTILNLIIILNMMWKTFANKRFNNYTNLNKRKVIEQFESSEDGLDQAEAEKRLKIVGPNELKKTKKFSALKLFISQFANPLVIVLIISAVISYFFAGEGVDASLIMLIVVFNAAIGFRQEYAAEKIIESLKKMASPKAKVFRNGKLKTIPSSEIVPGDVLLLEAGDIISADARIIKCHNFYVLESILTGESGPVEKTEHITKSKRVIKAKNMIFSGTRVTKGKAYALVVSTGNYTEIGRIAKLMQETETKIPLVEKLKRLSVLLSAVTLAIILFVFLIGIYYHHDIFTMFKTAVSLGVAAIPEGLPVVVTAALAIGIKKIADKKALIRRLPAIETLGSIDVVFLDKTGTITKNEMTVTEVVLPTGKFNLSGIGYSSGGLFTGRGDKNDLKKLMACAYICNDAEHKETYFGDPTEIALIVAAEKYMKQFSDVLPIRNRKQTIEFTSERKMMSVLTDIQYTKGAPEKIIKLCNKVLVHGTVKNFDQKMKQKMIEKSDEMMNDALRVLAFAYRQGKDIKEKDMIFIGLVGMIDPPREHVDKAIEEAQSAGITVKMITGDHAITAKAIAEMIGISKDCKVVTGEYVDEYIKNNSKKIEEADVFARVTPQQKINIIDYFENKGYTTAMTGDGVNDAPALKRASMGIAVAEATDVAKAASQMILLKTHFQTILNAIEFGRGIMDNIRKFVLYLLTCNIAEVAVVAISTLLHYPIPLTPVQLLWINLVTDGPPAVALSLDPPAKDVMLRKPEGKHVNIINGKMSEKIISISILMTIILMFLVNAAAYDTSYLQTMVFTALVMFESVRIISVRKEFGQPLWNNKILILSLIFAFMMQLAIIYTDIGNQWFHVIPLTLYDWALLITLSVTLYITDVTVDKVYDFILPLIRHQQTSGTSNLEG